MADKFDLALEIAATHPQAVARYLEEHSPNTASSFIDAVPDEISTTILQSMLPYHAAKCIDQLPVDAAAKYLSALESRFAASILRYERETTRDAIVAAMPRQVATRVAILLHYPLSVVGAWINPTVLVLPADCRIADAKARILSEGYADYHRIYAVDTDQSLIGFVRLFHLLRAEDTGRLSEFMETLPMPLRANTSLDVALDDQGWRDSDYLPVVGRQGRLVGVLRYADLRAAISKSERRVTEGDLPGTFMDLAETCYLGLADVMNTSLAAENVRTATEAH